ncbi:MAG: TonB-dependent receptor [Acidobacteriota bacterium]
MATLPAIPSSPRGHDRGAWLVWAVLAVLQTGLFPASVEAQSTSENAQPSTSYDGLQLSEALHQLRLQGLKIVFTSEVVTPDMRVTSEPIAVQPRQILEEILLQHDLRVIDGPNETLVVVRAQDEESMPQGSLRGVVRSSVTSAPLKGVEILIRGTEVRAVSDAEGSFALEGLTPGTYALLFRGRGFVVEQLEQVSVGGVEPAVLTIDLDPAPINEDELIVTPSRVSLLRTDPEGLFSLSRREILALPHLGNDFFRTLTLLPGITANDVSAQFHVRGGRRDETQILLDGQELYETYHLQDFDNALSVIEPTNLDSVELKTGGFSSEFGDRMSGVLDMTTIEPDGPPQGRVGVSIWAVYAGGRGTFNEGKGGWVAQVRRGSTDFAGRLVGREDPKYWDAFAKLDYSLTPRHSLRGNALYTGDEFSFIQVVDVDSQDVNTNYDNSYLWLTHQAILSDEMFVESAVSLSRINRDRRATEIEEDNQFTVDDRRNHEILAFRQAWNVQIGDRHLTRFGFTYRNFDTEYDYLSTRETENPIPEPRPQNEENMFAAELSERHPSFYLTDNYQVTEKLVLELGLRYDSYTQTDEDLVSPRFNLAYSLNQTSLARLAWGKFVQSQRPYELMVEDGDNRFYDVEQAEHRLVGYEKLFPGVTGARGLSVRAEIYWRNVDNPRPRYENLYEPLNFFPEAEPDRVRIEPERSLAQGIEIFVRGSIGERVGWWVNYAYAETEDLIDGSWFPREYDQPNTFNVDFDFLLSKNWRLNLAWRYHTGWPTTDISLQPVDVGPSEEDEEETEVEYEVVLGPFNGNRLPYYQRFDVRASRKWNLSFGDLTFFVDIQNVLNRRNVAGFDIEIDTDEGVLEPIVEEGAGILPSLGVTIEF